MTLAVYGVSVTKSKMWRGQQEPFSNVYHVKRTNPTNGEIQAITDTIATWEVANHNTDTSFTSKRAWGPFVFSGDGISEKPDEDASQTRYIADMLTLGNRAMGAEIYAELAVGVSWYVGRSPSTGRKRFLRKYYHSTFGVAWTAQQALRGDVLTASNKTQIQSYLDALESAISAAGWTLCAPNGDEPSASKKIMDHLHIRQFTA
jgi:hypothetical protein